MAEIEVRMGEAGDGEAIAALEKVCFSDPWSLESVMHDLCENPLAWYMVAEDKETGTVAGYAGIWVIAGEGHITNVAVAPEYRRCGIGQMLVDGLRETGGTRGAVSFTLEVRESNTGAIALYEKKGFDQVGVRPHYYSDGENAVIMWLAVE